MWCHYKGPTQSLALFTISDLSCLGHSAIVDLEPLATIIDRNFLIKTLSIDFLSFNILIQNEQLATNKQLKASIKYMYE